MVLAACLVPCVLAAAARAGITVTSYQTVALTNAFAPLSQDQYFAQQTLANVSPALADVSSDWTGSNAGGSTATWHWVGSAQAMSTTAFDANSLTVTAAGSFVYEFNTTAEFSDPRSSTIYSPAGSANYRGFFETDVPLVYMISVQLNRRGRVRLGSLEGGVVFDYLNLNPAPFFLELSGTIPRGHYDFLASTSLAAPNFPNGVNHFVESGSYENLTLTVQVPEPKTLGLLIVAMAMYCRRRHCTGHWGRDRLLPSERDGH